MLTLSKLKECYKKANENISTPENRIIFNREQFIKTMGCDPNELEGVCLIKRLPEVKLTEKLLPNEYIASLVNSGNEEEITVTYHDGAFYQVFLECIATFEIVDVAE